MLRLLTISLMLLKVIGCNAENLLVLTDIHFDPYFDCFKSVSVRPCGTLRQLIQNPVTKWPLLFSYESLNSEKQETNNAFLTQGINQLESIVYNHKVKVIIITGDLLRHNFALYYKKFAPQENMTAQALADFSAKTAIYVLQTITTKFPQAKIYIVLGNNDTDHDDYQLASHLFLEQIGNYLSKFVNNHQAFIHDFAKGGYFSTYINHNVRLIGLNSNILAVNGVNPILATQQLAWLRQQLANAATAHDQVILLQHIPFGIDWYTTATTGKLTMLLNEKIQESYLEILHHYAATITTIYAGHYHQEYFSLVNSELPIIGSLAFNNLFGNNPGFKVVKIDANGNFIDATTYYFKFNQEGVSSQQLYSFSQTYGSPLTIVDDLNHFPFAYYNPKVIAYRKYFNGNNSYYPQPITTDSKWPYYYCGIKYVQAPPYKSCLESKLIPPPQ